VTVRRWECPNCDATHVTRGSRPQTPFHACRGLKGLTVPLLEAGTAAKVVPVEWGDYVGKEQVQTDGDGRPVMAVVTTRDDGQDCTVFAPLATGRVR
jgi:hypothetical protein